MRPWFAFAPLILIAACGGQDAAAPVNDEAVGEAPAAPAGPPAITAEGWGPIRMEMTHEEAVAALGGKIIPDDIVHDEDWLACHMIRPAEPEGVWIMVEEDRVTRVTIEPQAASIASDRGIRVGDPEANVRAVYPTGLKEEPHKYQDPPAKYLTWWATPDVAGIRYVIGDKGVVESIHGGTPAITYVEGCS